MRAFIKQLRIETGLRVCNKVYEEHGDKPSKVCNVNINIFAMCLFNFKLFSSGGSVSQREDSWTSR
jgi:hypothetical protein